ncbi:hypothetical protein PENNAL_c0001G12025 [Penicillium nalgiovense]|uniref:Uncharacterized protein n=1 Tax=Penicillium nalgiovense TaxID=60175 RepID=A0A1V6ZA99_PENNA|nr:hypothetical protein PENNAL_c0001G12025 [Penicillium nalgiovense]
MILGGVVSLGIEFLNQETYTVVLIRRKTELLSKEFDRADLRSTYKPKQIQESLQSMLLRGLKRPLQLYVKSPIVLLLSTYLAIIYGFLYLFFTIIPSVFGNAYHWSTGISGLAYLGIGLGFLIGFVVQALTSDRIIVKSIAQNNSKYQPEMRLPTMIF